MAANTGYDVSVDTIFVQGLPEDTTEDQLEEYFGQIGIIKLDRKNNCKKIWIYKDKTTGKGKGEATITYDDPPTATSAINWFNGKEFRGSPLKIELAQRKSNPQFQRGGGGGSGFRGGPRGGGGGGSGGQFRGSDRGDRGNRPGGSGRPGDWMCPSCSNNNFAYRNECNRCRTPKPAGAGGEDNSRGPQHNSGGGGGRYHSESRVNQGARNGGGSNYRDNDARGGYHQHRDGNRDRNREGQRDYDNRGNGSFRDRDDRNRSYGGGGEGGGSGPSRSVHRGGDRRQRPY